MSVSDDEDSCSLPDDEVTEIKRAMRVAKARKQSLSLQMKHKIDKNSADRSELESIIRRQSSELTRTQNLLSQTDFDLKEARFEMNRIHEREARLKDEKQLIETKSKEIIGELKQQLQQKNIVAGERTQIAVFECDKLIKTLASLYKSVFDGRGSNALAPKTTKQLLDKASRDAENLKEFLQSKTPATSSEGQVSILQARLSAENQVESGCDNALLDMCRSLEEENRSLTETVETMKVQLAESNRDASLNRLIPHYRLAIVRSRTYAANLLEQVKREQATSQTLREQLDATYVDLKKVVEEKRRLFTRMSKYSLQLEEKDSFLAHQRGVDEQHILGDADKSPDNGSPLRGGRPEADDTMRRERPRDRSSAETKQEQPALRPVSAPISDYLTASLPSTGPNAVSRSHSPYLREAGAPSATASSARIPSESTYAPAASSTTHLKAELSQLDSEIEQLKEKLGKAAMLRSQRILSEVLDAHAPNYNQ